MSKKPNILVVGSVNMDLLLMTPRLPKPGETMFSEKYFFNPGGKGGNQVVAASLLGGNATFAGKVGNDSFADTLRQTLNDYGVNTDFLSVSQTRSGFAAIMLEENGQNRIIVHPAANSDLSKADIDRAFEGDYDGMIVQFEIPEEIVIYACNKAKKRGIPAVVDAGPTLAFPLEKIHGIEILSPNETETAYMCGMELKSENDYKKAAQILSERSKAKYIVLKLGEKGACVYSNGEINIYPTHKVNAIDSTAAGDVFTAAMTIEYLKSGSIEAAVKYANAAGALAVTKAGAQQSIPSKQEVDSFLRERS